MIVGVDPGPTMSAVVTVDMGARRVVDTFEAPNEAVVVALRDRVAGDDDVLVIERIASYGMPVGAAVFETAYWSGRFAEAWGGRVARLTFNEVKYALCHTHRAKESYVRRAVLDLIGEPGTKKQRGPTYGVHGHCWSALAVAVAWQVRTAHEGRHDDAGLGDEA